MFLSFYFSGISYFIRCFPIGFRFHSAEGMVVISVKDMLLLSYERSDKSRERFLYVV